jgi:hypothetical protein
MSCKNTVIPSRPTYDGSKSKNYFYNQVTCEKQKQIFEALKGILSTGGKPLLAYDIKISNDGGDVAENIKIRSPIDVQASAFDQDGNSIKISSLQDGRLFSIPALNPRESATVRLVSTTPVQSEYDDSPTKPSVTFSGGKASSRDFIYVSSRYAEVVKFLDSISLFFQVVIILVGAFIVTMIWILPLSLMAEAAQKRQAAKTEAAKTA